MACYGNNNIIDDPKNCINKNYQNKFKIDDIYNFNNNNFSMFLK